MHVLGILTWVLGLLSIFAAAWLYRCAGESLALLALVLVGFTRPGIGAVVFPFTLAYFVIRRHCPLLLE